MKLTTKTIGEISEQIKTGKTPPTKKQEYFNGDIQWYTPGDFTDSMVLEQSNRTITESAVYDKKATIYKENTVLISCIGDIGKVGILKSRASCNQQITGIKLKSIIDPLFFSYWCRANKKVLQGKASNAIIPILNNAVLSKISITYPESTLDQFRIGQLLSKVERIITQRKQQLHQLDELVNSVFFSMFGEPVRNERKWNKLPLDKLLSNIDSGWSPKCESVPAVGEQWGVLKLSAITSGCYKPSKNKAMLPNVEPKTQHAVKDGDLLFARKNTHDLVAATAFVYESPSKLLLPDLIFRLVIKDKNEIHPIYLWKLLSYPSKRKEIQSLAAGAAGSMPNISKANLKSALIPVPEIGLQHKFVEIVSKIKTITDSCDDHLNDLELLYGSLSQKAFKGELDLSAIQLSESPEQQVKYNKDVESEFLKVNQLQSKIERVTNTLESINKPFELIKNLTQPIEQLTKPITQYVEDFSSLKVTPDFSNDKIRQKWLVKLLKEQLTALDIDCLLDLSEFWEFAQDWISNFEQKDGDSFSFSIDDYEVLKNFVFNEVRNGLLLQEYEESSNSIKFKMNKK